MGRMDEPDKLDAEIARIPSRPFMSPILCNLPECPQTLFARRQGLLYYGACEYLEKEFWRLEPKRPEQKHFGLVLDGAVSVDPASCWLRRRAGDERAAAGCTSRRATCRSATGWRDLTCPGGSAAITF